MKPIAELEQFLFNDIDAILANLNANIKAHWGAMDAQQMIEHLKLSVVVSAGELEATLLTPVEKVEQVKTVVLRSGRPMQKGIKNPAIAADPTPHEYANLSVAVSELHQALQRFKQLFVQQPNAQIMHNIFGPLDYHHWLWFHYKHFTHHFTQFGLLPEQASLL